MRLSELPATLFRDQMAAIQMLFPAATTIATVVLRALNDPAALPSKRDPPA
jgi:hypothetical protein